MMGVVVRGNLCFCNGATAPCPPHPRLIKKQPPLGQVAGGPWCHSSSLEATRGHGWEEQGSSLSLRKPLPKGSSPAIFSGWQPGLHWAWKQLQWGGTATLPLAHWGPGPGNQKAMAGLPPSKLTSP